MDGGEVTMKVNSDYRAGLDKIKNDQLQIIQGGERFGQMVVKQGATTSR